MKKYTGLIVLAALAASSVLVVKAAPDEKYQGRKAAAGISETQIGQLDKRLSDRITEQQDLLSMVEKLLRRDFLQKTEDRAQATNVLSGQAKPADPAVVTPAAKATVKVAEAPWWLDYKPQMVYLSGADRYAVVNGKMYTNGQTMGKDIVVDKIEDDAVVLRLGREKHTYFLKK